MYGTTLQPLTSGGARAGATGISVHHPAGHVRQSLAQKGPARARAFSGAVSKSISLPGLGGALPGCLRRIRAV